MSMQTESLGEAYQHKNTSYTVPPHYHQLPYDPTDSDSLQEGIPVLLQFSLIQRKVPFLHLCVLPRPKIQSLSPRLPLCYLKISFFFLNVSFFIWFYGKLLLRDYTFYSLFYYCYILLEEGWHGHIVVVVVVVVVFLVQTTFFILLYFGLYTIYIHSLLHIKVLFSNLCLISLFNFFFSLALPFLWLLLKLFMTVKK